MTKQLWTPDADRLARHPLTAFAEAAAPLIGHMPGDYDDLHRWSVDDRAAFWRLLWEWGGVVGTMGETVLEEGADMRGDRFFPQARLNLAENLLAGALDEGRRDRDALVFRGEDRVERRLSWKELHDLVSRLAAAMRAEGVKPGDRVCAMLPNMPEAIVGMLASASIGAIWSSASPDFGVRGVLDRFEQIEPTLMLACDGYSYASKTIDVADKLAEITASLKPRKTIVVDYVGRADAVAARAHGGVTFDAFVKPFEAGEIAFERLAFDHPAAILFSSGTTGTPKCIVHGGGGLLLQHLKEHRLHCGIGDGDRVFYFTTCGWMMWNWLASALASGATLLLYDGSPFQPGPPALFDYLQAERATFFGTSAKFIDAVRNENLRPAESHDLSALRTIASTGSPLSPECFEYVYDAVKRDVHLASISGGTDICSCFVLGVPWRPVYAGEIQGPGLGMAVDVFDTHGKPLPNGKGDLVCKRAFPSMPVSFWNDPTGERYTGAYFGQFDGVWCHGDFAEWTAHGGIVIHGRSDATLNPQGVRIGTAEIYNVVETMPEIAEAICIGQPYENDVRVVLFVKLAEGHDLDDALRERIRSQIRREASPRHVPAKILAVSDIPRTKSGKIVELAVREVVEGRPVKNLEALANPQALDDYAGRAELD